MTLLIITAIAVTIFSAITETRQNCNSIQDATQVVDALIHQVNNRIDDIKNGKY